VQKYEQDEQSIVAGLAPKNTQLSTNRLDRLVNHPTDGDKRRTQDLVGLYIRIQDRTRI
jgi:hypothetical protein